MKYLIICLLLVSATLSAQSKLLLKEEVNDGSFHFQIKVDRQNVQELVYAFAEVSDTEVHPRFRGDWEREAENGIVYFLHTRRRTLTISYDGKDAALLRTAQLRTDVVRQHFGYAPKYAAAD